MSDFTNQALNMISQSLTRLRNAARPSPEQTERIERRNRERDTLEEFARYESQHREVLRRLPIERRDATSSVADYLAAATTLIGAVQRLVQDVEDWQDRLRPIGRPGDARDLAPVIFQAAADGETPQRIAQVFWKASQYFRLDRLAGLLGDSIPRLLFGYQMIGPVIAWPEARRPADSEDVDGLTPTGEVRYGGTQTVKSLGQKGCKLFGKLWDNTARRPREEPVAVDKLIRELYPNDDVRSAAGKNRVVNKLTTLIRRVNGVFEDSSLYLRIVPAGKVGKRISHYSLREP
jgi:hypothetical protein